MSYEKNSLRGRRKVSPLDRFWMRVEKADNDCWEWQGGGGRYGKMMVDGQRVTIHRWAYEQFVGPIPDGLHLHHTCSNTMCVNPDHLVPVTASENTAIYYRIEMWGKEVCRNGLHDMTDPSNVRITPKGTRKCRACVREGMRKLRASQGTPS